METQVVRMSMDHTFFFKPPSSIFAFQTHDISDGFPAQSIYQELHEGAEDEALETSLKLQLRYDQMVQNPKNLCNHIETTRNKHLYS